MQRLRGTYSDAAGRHIRGLLRRVCSDKKDPVAWQNAFIVASQKTCCFYIVRLAHGSNLNRVNGIFTVLGNTLFDRLSIFTRGLPTKHFFFVFKNSTIPRAGKLLHLVYGGTLTHGLQSNMLSRVHVVPYTTKIQGMGVWQQCDNNLGVYGSYGESFWGPKGEVFWGPTCALQGVGGPKAPAAPNRGLQLTRKS